MAKIDENYIEKLVNAVVKMIVEAIENISIEDVNMYKIGYAKAIDEFAERLLNCGMGDFNNIPISEIKKIAEQMKAGDENELAQGEQNT